MNHESSVDGSGRGVYRSQTRRNTPINPGGCGRLLGSYVSSSAVQTSNITYHNFGRKYSALIGSSQYALRWIWGG